MSYREPAGQGELGYEVYPVNSGQAPDVWDAIIAAGNPLGMLVSGLSWSKALESGLMVFSMGTRDERINPLEHWRTNLVDLDKGPFIGRAALEKIIACGGPSRKITGLAGGAEPLSRIERPCRIRYRDKDIGVTRAPWPSLQRCSGISAWRWLTGITLIQGLSWL